MERHLGRALRSDEIVHHINTIKTDNGIDNLFLCANASEHQRAHRSLDDLVPDLLSRGLIYFDRTDGVYKLCQTIKSTSS
ncbi:HNH endonuclease [Mycobacterium phage Yeet]|nr:HNH endonuclease [Mycobacterium phage Yeet]